MSSVVLWSLSVVTTPVVLGAAPSTASVTAIDQDRPQRRSEDHEVGPPGLQMGAGPTAIAMVALMVAIVGRSLRRRRGDSRSTV